MCNSVLVPLDGSPLSADIIYETAASTRTDLIDMSTHGHGRLDRWLYSSVADEVLRRVPVRSCSCQPHAPRPGPSTSL
jgi:nucleotide-binding universal stress UspA family protein